MSRLYLRCVLCSRQQANGLLSGAGWGVFELPAGHNVQHPALQGSTLRACPGCVEREPRWQERALVTLGIRVDEQPGS